MFWAPYDPSKSGQSCRSDDELTSISMKLYTNIHQNFLTDLLRQVALALYMFCVIVLLLKAQNRAVKC